MHQPYEDIMVIAKSAGCKPLWWDENGVPRFATHHPRLCPDIYASEVVLLLISCQNCGCEFHVQMSWSVGAYLIDIASARALAGVKAPPPALDWNNIGLRPQVLHNTIHYGDPPNAWCCPSGPTMNCWDLKVLEFWSRLDYSSDPKMEARDWRRVPELEVELADMTDPDRVRV